MTCIRQCTKLIKTLSKYAIATRYENKSIVFSPVFTINFPVFVKIVQKKSGNINNFVSRCDYVTNISTALKKNQHFFHILLTFIIKSNKGKPFLLSEKPIKTLIFPDLIEFSVCSAHQKSPSKIILRAQFDYSENETEISIFSYLRPTSYENIEFFHIFL